MKGERLIQQRSASGRALAAFEARTADAAVGAEDRAWRALQQRLAGPPSRRWLIWPAAALGAGAAAALAIAFQPVDRRADPVRLPVTPAPIAAEKASVVPPPVATTMPLVEPPAVVLPTRPRPLSGERIRLAGGTVLSLGQRTRAQGSQQAGKTRLLLESGTLELAVAPGHSKGVSVRAGVYRFVDLGTVFQVTRRGDEVSLRVDEGAVAVWHGPQRLATVNAGGYWSSSAAPTRVAVVAPIVGTLAAETALYEQARRLAWKLRDLPGALATLREHRRRFPRSALRTEVDLTLVELLPQMGRFDEALDESEALLARDPRHERAAELHLLRGNILRESFRDYARAAGEYAAVRDAVRPGASVAVADDAAFFEAVCLEAVGRPGAADAYRRYLAGPAPRHAAAARARLSALAP
jgi:ferric-dicitrate binding protein FerR (iron transport regulator)